MSKKIIEVTTYEPERKVMISSETILTIDRWTAPNMSIGSLITFISRNIHNVQDELRVKESPTKIQELFNS